MKPIAKRVGIKKLLRELTDEHFLRETNYGHNKIYTFYGYECPNLMHEIGRLREISFREAGGGTGEAVDIDHYDTSDQPFKQLIVWDPDDQVILGGYRYLLGNNLPRNEKGEVVLATSRLFHLSDKFINEVLPHTIELGRSFVQPQYQSSKAGAKSLYALDNLWDGLGTLIIHYPEMKYFFGKVTMYTHFNQEARDYILGFMKLYFRDKENLVYPHKPVKISFTDEQLKSIFTGDSFEEDYKILSKKVRTLGENIPPLINAYMNLSPSMRTFGTAINDRFGDVEETGIIITIKDLYKQKVRRHVTTYKKKDKYFIWLKDRKRYLIEEIWIRKLGFKIEKITFKTGKGEILCRICFRYDSSRQVSGMKMRDRQGTIVEITYKTFSPSPEIDPNMFNLFPNF